MRKTMKRTIARSIFTAGAALIITLSILAGFSEASLVSDGDFSNPYVPGIFQTYFSGSSFGPWTVTSGSIDLIGTYWQAPPLGGQSVDMDGDSPGSIRQDLGNLAPGSYQLTFYLAGNPDGGPGTKTLNVQVGGASSIFTFDVTDDNNKSYFMGWTPETLSFTSPGGDTLLTLTSLDAGSSPYGPVIGNVALSDPPVPEPCTILLFGIGLAGFAGRRLRNRSCS